MVEVENEPPDIQHNYKETVVSAKHKLIDTDNPKKDKYIKRREKLRNRLLPNKPYIAEKFSTRKFYLDVTKASSTQLKPCYDDDHNSTSTSVVINNSTISSEILDTVRSGESLIKCYEFDALKYNSDTDKCVSFWRTLMQQENLQPVKSNSMKAHVGEKIVGEEKVEGTTNNYLWYNTLMELQKRKMDELALAATSQQCKLCGREEPYSEFKQKGQKYPETALRDNEDITCLNDWPFKQTPKLVDASANVQRTGSCKDLHITKLKESEYPLHVKQNQNVTTKVDVQAEQELRCSSPIEGNIKISEQQKEDTTDCRICNCIKELCFCNEAETSFISDHDLPEFLTHLPEFIIQEPESTHSMDLEIKKDGVADELKKLTISLQEESRSAKSCFLKQCTCGEAECICDANKQKLEPYMPTKCAVCNKIHCQCKKHLDEEASLFLDQLRYQLKSIRKNKSCSTMKQEKEEEKISKIEQLCVICGHDDCSCRESQKPKYFHFIHFHDNNSPSAMTEEGVNKNLLSKVEKLNSTLQKMTSDHTRKNVCHQEQNINIPVTSKISSTVTLTAKHSSHDKQILNISDQRSKTIINKNVILIEPNVCDMPLKAQGADVQKVISEDILSEGSNIQRTGGSKLKLVKRNQNPMLWYSSEIPQKREFLMLPRKKM